MPIRVRVRDYQSLGDVEIVIDGLTVVSGPNNTGKSALVRAIRGAFQNTKGTSFVRHGRSKAVVEIDFGDGHTLVWEKGKGKDGKPTYTIDGGKPFHPGQGVPDEVKALGVRPISAGGRDIWPQIAPQFQQVFLLDQPGSVMAEAVADLERVSQLNEALKLAASDLRSATAELTTRRSDLATLEGELKRFDGLDDVAAQVAQIETKAALVKRVDTALQGLFVLRDRRNAAREQVESLSGIENVIVPSAEVVDALRTLLQQVAEYTVVRDRLVKARTKVKALEGVERVVVPDPVALLDKARDLDALRELARRHQRAKAQVERLEKADLNGAVDVSKVERFQTALQTAIGLRDHHRLTQSRVLDAERELALAVGELDQATEELTGSLGSQCPVCGSTLQHGGHT